eukprot:scaffold97056_cov46-Cyclotella_meneghiniana.AAC.2
MSKAKDFVDDALATAMHAMRTTVATTLGSAPNSLAYLLETCFSIYRWLRTGKRLHKNGNNT